MKEKHWLRGKRIPLPLLIWVLLLGGALPSLLVAGMGLWWGELAVEWKVLIALLVITALLLAGASLQRQVVYPLQTISNLLAALREGDYSIRARSADRLDALGHVLAEINALGQTLHQQRLDALEVGALLRKVMDEIEVAVFTFDAEGVLCLVNRAGEELLAQPAERLIGRSAKALGLSECLQGAQGTREMAFPGGMGRWRVRRSIFREGGLPHHLLVLTDLSQTLREEERQAWQRLLRVLSHELNNSLTPIKSLAGSLTTLLQQQPLPEDWMEDARRGLAVIASRAESLGRFTRAYSQLARLPQPVLSEVSVPALIRRVCSLQARLQIRLLPGPDLIIQADPDQLEQVLINLLKNAEEASAPAPGRVEVGWEKRGNQLQIVVRDEGPGLANTANLFVPFFTTKPHGSGVGLVLCRQIAEAHGGSLNLQNRSDRSGCEARLVLPL